MRELSAFGLRRKVINLLRNEYREILACPQCKDKLQIVGDTIQCEGCGKSYDIVEGIPVLVGSETSKQEHHISQVRHFNKYVKKFETYHLDNWRISFMKRAFSKLDIGARNDKSPPLYLDVGCGGSGYMVIEAAKTGVRAVGCDLSFEAMAKANYFARQQGVLERCLFVVCDAERLPFKSNAFGAVSSIALLEHVLNDDSLVAEISRVAKEEAKIFVTVPNTEKRIWFFLRPLYLWHNQRMGHVRTYSEEELGDRFEKAGFRLCELKYSGHLIKFLQLLLNYLPASNFRDRLWWKIEEVDLGRGQKKSGLNLSAVFGKVS
ncbi:MAG: class I SAM-dependent methyltransferase [Actinobacteria bacterium]|nr:class I SAM-dependent methyltransferase [Actinomycetota bacterium]